MEDRGPRSRFLMYIPYRGILKPTAVVLHHHQWLLLLVQPHHHLRGTIVNTALTLDKSTVLITCYNRNVAYIPVQSGRGPTVHTHNPIYFPVFSNNIWSYLLIVQQPSVIVGVHHTPVHVYDGYEPRLRGVWLTWTPGGVASRRGQTQQAFLCVCVWRPMGRSLVLCRFCCTEVRHKLPRKNLGKW